MSNEIGMNGISFIEFTSSDPRSLANLFREFGFSRLAKHETLAVDYFKQNDIHFLLNRERGSFGDGFAQNHGPSICSMGWRVKDPDYAFELALTRGAEPAALADYQAWPAIFGIGGSLIYFVKDGDDRSEFARAGFRTLPEPELQSPKGFTVIDHLTNNVEKGTMQQWADFYKHIFDFTEVRYFDIRGAKTGLTSYALRSPCGKFCIPINEASESKSQINEYLEQYRGPGIQHLAFLTDDILKSLDSLRGSSISTLDIDDEYYADIFSKFPQVTEDHVKLRDQKVLVDGDEKGYLLQIFTRNLIGPIFIEIIQRKNHLSFGEGNFGALFRSLERDQMKRGYLT